MLEFNILQIRTWCCGVRVSILNRCKWLRYFRHCTQFSVTPLVFVDTDGIQDVLVRGDGGDGASECCAVGETIQQRSKLYLEI